MFNKNFYYKHLSISDVDTFVQSFQDNLLKTNRDHDFYVNWVKIEKNARKCKIELNILNSLIGAKNIKQEFMILLDTYPEVVRTFPILIAVRELEFEVIDSLFNKEITTSDYNFDVNRGDILNQNQKEDYFDFIVKTGIVKLFDIIKDFFDYILGVEVGMDTNARKNRGGKAMETLIEPLLMNICDKYEINCTVQNTFNKVEKEFGIDVPVELRERRGDFILTKNGMLTNVEVNFFSGPGSKPEEIVDSYINRYNELQAVNSQFIWITDGKVWKTSTNQLKKAVNNQKYLFNIEFIKKGLLEEAIKEIFSLNY